jgi:hypothetical protein
VLNYLRARAGKSPLCDRWPASSSQQIHSSKTGSRITMAPCRWKGSARSIFPLSGSAWRQPLASFVYSAKRSLATSILRKSLFVYGVVLQIREHRLSDHFHAMLLHLKVGCLCTCSQRHDHASQGNLRPRSQFASDCIARAYSQSMGLLLGGRGSCTLASASLICRCNGLRPEKRYFEFCPSFDESMRQNQSSTRSVWQSMSTPTSTSLFPSAVMCKGSQSDGFLSLWDLPALDPGTSLPWH